MLVISSLILDDALISTLCAIDSRLHACNLESICRQNIEFEITWNQGAIMSKHRNI